MRRSMFDSIVRTAALFFSLIVILVSVADAVVDPSLMSFWVGPAERILGPNGDDAGVSDNLFSVIEVQNNVYIGYTANMKTRYFQTNSVAGVADMLGSTLQAPSALDKGSSFDDGGAWINAAVFDGTKVRAWYHAEQIKVACPSYVHRSIAYAESSNGTSFTKVNYPSNKVLDSGDLLSCGKTGLGDHSVITWNNNYYIYFIDQSAGGKLGVATSTVASEGKPGTWYKWCYGSFSCDGVGGGATFLGPGYQGIDASVYTPDNRPVLLYQNWQEFNGLQMTFMSDATTPASSINEPLLYYKNDGEHIFYASIVPPSGGKNWSNSFYLYYLYLQPGEDFQKRYLVRRKVDVTLNPYPVSPQVMVALTRYFSDDPNLNKKDHWVTTGMVAPEYTEESTLGYLFTKGQAGMRRLDECYDASGNDHMVSTKIGHPTDDECVGPMMKYLRPLGWVWETQKPGTVPLYRCHWISASNHFVSLDPNCETDSPDVTEEGLLGYVYPAEELPQFTLSVNKTGTGSGIVTSSPAGIACGVDCSEAYFSGAEVTLSAAPNAGSTFAGWTGGGCAGIGTCVVTMNSDTTIAAIFTLATTYSISGTVTSGGSPLSGVTMILSGAASGTTTTDASGNYSFSGLANGNYTVTPSKTGYTFTPVNRAVTINSANVTAQDFTAEASTTTHSIAGHVTTSGGGPGGNPLSGVTMTLSGASSGTTTTDASGDYSFSGLANGNYTVTPSKTGYTFTPVNRAVTINSANVTAQDFTAQAVVPSTYSISGTVTSGGSPLSGVTMTLTGASSGATTTDASGNYTFTGLSNGSYTVTPSKAGYTFTPVSRAVTIGGANVTAQNFTAISITTYSISGKVATAGSGGPGGGSLPLSGVTMTLTGASSGATTTDASGNYTFTGLSNGSYTVTPSKAGYTFTPVSRAVTISGANVTGQNFTAQ